VNTPFDSHIRVACRPLRCTRAEGHAPLFTILHAAVTLSPTAAFIRARRLPPPDAYANRRLCDTVRA
jgi:hypothetical protein